MNSTNMDAQQLYLQQLFAAQSQHGMGGGYTFLPEAQFQPQLQAFQQQQQQQQQLQRQPQFSTQQNTHANVQAMSPFDVMPSGGVHPQRLQFLQHMMLANNPSHPFQQDRLLTQGFMDAQRQFLQQQQFQQQQQQFQQQQFQQQQLQQQQQHDLLFKQHQLQQQQAQKDAISVDRGTKRAHHDAFLHQQQNSTHAPVLAPAPPVSPSAVPTNADQNDELEKAHRFAQQLIAKERVQQKKQEDLHEQLDQDGEELQLGTVAEPRQDVDSFSGTAAPESSTTVITAAIPKVSTKTAKGKKVKANKPPKRTQDTKWLLSYEELKGYKKENGDCIVPRGYALNPRLASWVAEQRKQYKLLTDGKPSSITTRRIDLLNALDFAWNAQEAAWERHMSDLQRFRDEFGDCLVPLNHPKYPKLGLWVKEQRRHYTLMKQNKPSHMTEERAQNLDSVGFCWDTHEAVWGERLRELCEYKSRYGDCIVPTNYSENPKLGTWVHHQRRQYKKFMEKKPCHITNERIRALESLGFVWYPRERSRSTGGSPSNNSGSSSSGNNSGSDTESDTDISCLDLRPRKRQHC